MSRIGNTSVFAVPLKSGLPLLALLLLSAGALLGGPAWSAAAALNRVSEGESPLAGPGPADSKLPATAQTGAGIGELYLHLNPDAISALGIRVVGSKGGELRLPLVAGEHSLEVVLDDGAPTSIGSGELLVPQFQLRRKDGIRTPELRLVRGGDGLDLSLQDAQGRQWFRIIQAMRWPDVGQAGFRLLTADLRAGAALAAFVGMDVEDMALANASLRMPLAFEPGGHAVGAKTCAAPVWSGTPGTVTDVSLTTMDRIDVLRCRRVIDGGACDGPGGSDGEVVIVPSATLQNSGLPNATDIPWFRMFSTAPEYGGIDQHPYLVWNLYRLGADGSIAQIARSGLKHAFASANSGCDDPSCVPYGNILGRSCGDIYNATSNDCDRFLGSRSEIIPAAGIWGRCGSIQDPDCDGMTVPAIPAGFSCVAAQDSPASDKYSYRLRALESDIDLGQNAGAEWLVDAWYVIRGDNNIYNGMGSRQVYPVFYPGPARWTMGTPGPYVSGAVIDRWLERADAAELTSRSTAVTAEGEVGVATRVQRLPDGRYQYDYAVMNFDFSRSITDPMTSEPNLRLISNRGLSAVTVEMPNGGVVDSATYTDGDADTANDWSGSVNGSGWQWQMPTNSASFDWGQLRFFRLISADLPGSGAMTLGVAESGSPSSYSVSIIAPDASIRVFAGGFEQEP